MVRWLLATLVMLFPPAPVAQDTIPQRAAPETQPATRPADTESTLRRPEQAELLRNLLRQQAAVQPIRPVQPTETGTPEPEAAQPALLPDGTFLVERSGRLVYEDGTPKFLLELPAIEGGPQTLGLLPCRLLESLEREARDGFDAFIISAEVTSYQGENYLLLRKVLRRVGHGNISP